MAGAGDGGQDGRIHESRGSSGGSEIDREQRQREIEWVERARSADPRAFRALYDLGFRLVFAWSLRALGSRGHAESLTAAALRRAFAALSDYDGSVSLGRWLIGHAERSLRVGEGSAPTRAARSAEDRS